MYAGTHAKLKVSVRIRRVLLSLGLLGLISENYYLFLFKAEDLEVLFSPLFPTFLVLDHCNAFGKKFEDNQISTRVLTRE